MPADAMQKCSIAARFRVKCRVHPLCQSWNPRLPFLFIIQVLVSWYDAFLRCCFMGCFDTHLLQSVESMLPSNRRGTSRRLSLQPRCKCQLLLRFRQHMLQQPVLHLSCKPAEICGHLHRQDLVQPGLSSQPESVPSSQSVIVG